MLRKLAILLALSLVVGRLDAQISTASVEVQVAGEDGAPLPGVTVTLENTETGLTRVEVTGEEGSATLPALSPGTYKAAFELQGFSPVSQEGFELRVGQTAVIRATLSAAANPRLPFVPNPNFGKPRATLPGREIQLGLRWAF